MINNNIMEELTKVKMKLNHRSLSNINELSMILNENVETKVISYSLQFTLEILKKLNDNKKMIIRDEKNGKEVELHINKL